jgi:DNA-binding MarR family transcriptional regulator
MSVELSPTIAALTAAIKLFLDTGAAPVLLPIFLLVAHFPDRTCAELAKLEEMSLSTMSRHLLVLGHGSLALIQTKAEAGDARYIRHSLTEKGLALVQKMTGALMPTIRNHHPESLRPRDPR